MTPADPGSRYAGLPEIRVVEPDGTTRTFLAPRVVPEPPVVAPDTAPRPGGTQTGGPRPRDEPDMISDQKEIPHPESGVEPAGRVGRD